MKIELDKIMHFLGGILGWMYFHYICGAGEKWSHIIVFILGGLWEAYFWYSKKDKFDFIDWFFVCLGAFVIHCIATWTWIYSSIGYGICIFMYYQLKKLWW